MAKSLPAMFSFQEFGDKKIIAASIDLDTGQVVGFEEPFSEYIEATQVGIAKSGVAPKKWWDIWPDECNCFYLGSAELTELSSLLGPGSTITTGTKSISLGYTSGGSDKVYLVGIEESIDSSGTTTYRLSAKWGRRGSTLRQEDKGSFTSLWQAEHEFDKLVDSKKRKGYAEE